MTDDSSSEEITAFDIEIPLLGREAEVNNDDNTGEEEVDASSSDTNDDDEEEEEKLPSMWRLVSLGKPEFCVLVVAGLFMVVSQVSGLYIPLLVGRSYDDLVDGDIAQDEKMKSINRLMLWALILHVSGAFAGGVRSTLMGVAGERIVARMRTTLYASMLKQEVAFFDATKSGELVSRLGSDTMIVKRAIASSWAEVSLGFVKLLATLALMFSLSPKLAGLTVGSTLGVFLVCLPFGRKLGKLSKAYQETLGEAQNLPTEVLGAVRTVKSFGAENREAGRYESIIGTPGWCPPFFCWGGAAETSTSTLTSSTTFRIGCEQSVVRAGFGFCIFGGGFGAMYATLWYGFSLVSSGELRIGDLSAFQAYILGIGGTLAHMSGSISNLIEARHASQRIFGLLDRKPKIGDPATAAVAAAAPDRGSGASRKEDRNYDDDDDAKISFSRVSFSYPTRPDTPVLRDFSLTIPRNKTTAIVGPSGAGKSTVISLLERFYDADEGSVRFDGADVRRIPLSVLRKRFGYVQQEPTLFGVSVRDNLRYGLEDPSSVTDDELLEACKTANAYDFVVRLPRGLDELVGERGVTLSGGQKQRLAIARAILGQPSVLLLDEATSALDAESEFLVQQAMDAASKGRTVVVVAHRLSTIKKADQIAVLGGGEEDDDDDHRTTLTDVGTHDELLRRCATYRNLIEKQSFHHPVVVEEDDDAAPRAAAPVRGKANAAASPARAAAVKPADRPTKIPTTPKSTPERLRRRDRMTPSPVVHRSGTDSSGNGGGSGGNRHPNAPSSAEPPSSSAPYHPADDVVLLLPPEPRGPTGPEATTTGSRREEEEQEDE